MSEELGTKEEALQFARYWKKEAEQLRKEAHDKHWPLANACRNKLPYAETNWLQVIRAAEELKQLRAEVAKMKPVYDAAVYLAEPQMLLCLSQYTSIGASVVNTVAIERLANAVRVSMEVDDEEQRQHRLLQAQ